MKCIIDFSFSGHHLKSILTGPIISATLNLPHDAAAGFLQDQVNNAFLKHQQSTNFLNINMGLHPSILQADGCSFTDEEDACLQTKSPNKDVEDRFRDSEPSCLKCNGSCSKEALTVKFKRKESRTSRTKLDRKSIDTDTTIKNSPSHMISITIALTTNNSTIFSSSLGKSKSRKIYQGDGTHSSSDDDDLDDDDDENDNEDDDDFNDDIEEETQEAAEDEPLNSEDDVSDADGTEESFETDNVIVCQFDKVCSLRMLIFITNSTFFVTDYEG